MSQKWKLPNKLRTTQVKNREASTLGSSGWVVTTFNIIWTQNLSWSSPDLWLNHILLITDWILPVLCHSLDTRLTNTPSHHWFLFLSTSKLNFYGLVTIALVNNNNKLSHWVFLDVTGCFVVYVTLWFRSKQMEDTFRASSKIRTFYRVV